MHIRANRQYQASDSEVDDTANGTAKVFYEDYIIIYVIYMLLTLCVC